MADDDEIDVMGDFNLDNILSKEDGRLSCYDGNGVLGSQNMSLLQCEYGLPSQWLLDNTTQPCWYSSLDEQRSPNSDPHQNMFSVSLSDSGMASSDDGEGWTDKEKRLLDRGIELFGRSPSRLAQFIGSKSPQQVRSYLRTRPQNFSDDLHVDFSTGRGLGFAELIDDFQIPVSVEEVIATVSTAQPTIPTVPTKQTTPFSTHETPHRTANSLPKLRKLQLPTHNKQSALSRLKKREHQRHHLPTVRKRNTVTVVPDPVKVVPSIMCKESGEVPTLLMTGTNRGVVLSSGEEVIKIQKEDNDSDEDDEIEIGDFDTVVENKPTLNSHISLDVPHVEQTSSSSTSVDCKEEPKGDVLCDVKLEPQQNFKECESVLEKCEEEIVLDIPVPTEEVVLNPDVITDNERTYHYEFFQGRSVKTPKRYLKIRNHIIDCWRSNKPSYVTKTQVRTGLRSCGDVNYIGRIHAYLEQIGAINFGCAQVHYIRPLRITLNNASSSAAGSTHVRKKASREQLKLQQQVRTEGVRQRKKKVFPDCWAPSEGEGGYTIIHSEDGRAIHTSKEPVRSEKTKRKVAQQKLVYCSKFDESKPAPFSVNLSIESLLIMDLHAHCSHSEVIGLLGGQYDTVRKVLHIYRSYPCRSSSSGVHCEMCPVAQKEVSEKLQGEGYEVVGWYHSHPTFFSNPSLQDLDTQSNMQTWMTKSESPFVSFILSPYCPTSKNMGSEYRCLIVEKSESDDQTCTPYRLSVDVISTGLDIDALTYRAKVIFALLEEHSDSDVDFSKEYKDHVLYFDKCVGSAKHHISYCKPPLSEDVKLELLETYSGIIELMVSFCR